VAGRRKVSTEEMGFEEDLLPGMPEPDDPEAQRHLEAGRYREYLRRRIATRFEQLTNGFLEAAGTGSAVHMRMIVALLESAETGAAVRDGDAAIGDAERAEQEWEELNRRGAVPNL
jgi:hypothetical protein